MTDRSTPIEINAQLQHLEREYDLLAHKIGDWSAWPVLRFNLQIALGYDLKSSAPRPKSFLIKRFIREAPALLIPRRPRILIKTFASGLADSDGGQFRDVWFDDIVPHIGPSLKIMTANNASFEEREKEALYRASISSPSIDLLTAVMTRTVSDTLVQPAARALAKALGSLHKKIDEQWIKPRLRHFEAARRVWSLLLKRWRPAGVMTADPGEYALTAAARELHIPVAEIQHGFLDRHHSGYSWTDYAAPYRAQIPVADRLLLFGRAWLDDLVPLGFWNDDTARAVGSPRIDRYRAQTVTRDGAKTVLFTTQGIDTERAITMLRAFMGEAGGAVNLVVKLHPVYDQDRTPYERGFAGCTGVQIIAGHEQPSTMELMQRADLHLSISSTCHYDAIALGVPTAVLPLESHEVVDALVQKGHARPIESPRDILNLALSAKALEPAIREYYYRPGAVENTLSELRSMNMIAEAA